MTKAEIIAAILSALAAFIILAGKLFNVTKKLISEKKYSKLFGIVVEAMEYVEVIAGMSGEDKKAKAMELSEEAARLVGISDVDRQLISDMIETIIDLSKKINFTSK